MAVSTSQTHPSHWSTTSPVLAELVAGLRANPRRLPFRYALDETGSWLYQKLWNLPERQALCTEERLLRRTGSDLVRPLSGDVVQLVQIGIGDNRSTLALLEAMAERCTAVSTVIFGPTEASTRRLTGRIKTSAAHVATDEVVGAVESAPEWLQETAGGRRLVFLPAPTLASVPADEAGPLLATLCNSLKPQDFVLIGAELRRDVRTLLAAYDDRSGLAHGIGVNLLHRLNSELQCTFDLDAFEYLTTYDAVGSAVQSWLVSRIEQTVQVPAVAREFRIDAWEPLLLCAARQFTVDQLFELYRGSGFQVVSHRTDARDTVACSLLRARP